MSISPSLAPSQDSSVTFPDIEIAGGCVIVIFIVFTQEVLLVTVTVYVPAESPL